MEQSPTKTSHKAINNKLDLSNLSVVQLAFITAFALTLYFLESFIPKPLPFLRLGLSNVVVLLLLLAGNVRAALLVIISKPVVSGLFTGLLFSPATMLSLSGSTLALITMSILIRSEIPFGLIGISLSGSVAHNLGQLFATRFFLIKQDSIFYLTPLLILLGIGTGIITGFIAGKLNKIL